MRAAVVFPSPVCGGVISLSCARARVCILGGHRTPLRQVPSWRNPPPQAARIPPAAPLWRTSKDAVGRGLVVMAAVAEPLEVLVKAASGQPDQLGDCPFSQRVLLTLEEKGIPYNARYVDTENKPEWFLEANPEGKVPVIKHEGSWVADSDVITALLEEKYPEPSLAVSEDKAAVGSKLFGAFVRFLKSKDPADGTEAALVDELKALNDFLKQNGPYVGGDKISAVDLSLAPKLYHLKITLDHFKKWAIPGDLTYLLDYIKDLHSRESFEKTAAPAPVVVKGWSKHVGG